MSGHFIRFLTFNLILMSLVACQGPTLEPTATLTIAPSFTITFFPYPIPSQVPPRTASPLPLFTFTPGPSPTPTRQSTLESHTFQAPALLIMAGTRDLDLRTPFGTSLNFLLLGDGTLIVRDCTKDICSYNSEALNQQQVCSLMNTIDQAGFFDYDPSTFVSPQESTHKVFIQVNAWRFQAIEQDQLDQWLQNPSWLDTQLHCKNCVQNPIILPALANTYYLLQDYRPAGLKIYQPQQMGLWLSSPWVIGTPVPWTLASPSLSDLYHRSLCQSGDQNQAVILSGEEASQVSELINQVLTDGYAPIFTDGNLTLQLSNQWLLPYENPATCSNSTPQATLIMPPAQSITYSCSPADGLIPVVTPTLQK